MRTYVALSALCAVGGLAALANGFVWDDHILIGEFPARAQLQSVYDLLTQPFWQDEHRAENRSGYYRPLISLGLLVEHHFFGSNPLGYHLSNLLLHGVCCVLAYRFVRRRVGALPAGLSLLSVVPFVMHPSRAESVAWISGRTDVWMTCLVLLTSELAFRGRRLAVAAAAAAALFCKETAIVVPLLLWTDRWAGLTRGPASRGRPELWATGGVAVALCVRGLVVAPPARLLAGISSLPVRVLTTLGHYAQGLIWPFWPQVIMGPLEGAQPLHSVGADFHTLLGGFALSVFVWALVCALRRSAVRPWFADMLWLFAPLLPALNVLPLGLLGLAALRFLYLPCLGLCALLARGLSRVERPVVPAFVVGAWALALGAVLQIYTLAWRSDASLWEYERSHSPDRLYAIARLGELHVAAGHFDRALREFLAGAKAAAAHGNHAGELSMTLRAASVLGKALPDSRAEELAALGEFYAAVRRAGRVELAAAGVTYTLWVPKLFAGQSRRDVSGVLVPEAALRMRRLDLPGARTLLEQALALDPTDKAARLALGRTLALLGERRQAAQQLEIARRQHPGDPDVVDLTYRLDRAARALSNGQTPALARAQVALLLGVARQAEHILASHPALADEHALWWELRVGAQLAMGDPRAAAQWLERGRTEHPEWSGTWKAAESSLAQLTQRLAALSLIDAE